MDDASGYLQKINENLWDLVDQHGADRAFMVAITLRVPEAPPMVCGFAVAWPKAILKRFPTRFEIQAALLELAYEWDFEPDDPAAVDRGILRATVVKFGEEGNHEFGMGMALLLKILHPDWVGVTGVYDLGSRAAGPQTYTPIRVEDRQSLGSLGSPSRPRRLH
jgi:hypothetical protein